MNIVRYLPSAQFVVIVSSIAISGALVVAAEKFTSSPTLSTLTPQTSTQVVATGDWMQTLSAIEGASVFTTTTPETADAASTLRAAAESTNLTDTVARTLLVNLSEAKSQGLGSDIPTQDKLIDQAVTQIKKERSATAYTQDDLVLSANTPAALKAYGNAVVAAIGAHPEANFNNTLYVIGTSTDTGSPKQLGELQIIQQGYQALADDLLKIKVPPVFLPLHIQIVNNLYAMATTYDDMAVIFSDPLRGLAGFQLYQGLNSENTRLFINIAQQLNQNGILFSKDEPGSAWASFLSIAQ